jgi:hypothetical protein
VALAIIPDTMEGVGAFQVTTSNLLDYTVFDGTVWSAIAQVNADATLGVPSVVGFGDEAYLVYLGTNYDYYWETFTAGSPGSWGKETQILPSGVTAMCGPTAGALAPLGTGASFVYVNGQCSGSLNHLYDIYLSGSTAGAPADIASNPSFSATTGTPAIAAPASGQIDLVTAFVAEGTQQVYGAYLSAGTWSAPAAITQALTNDPVALAPTTGSGVVMGYQGTDGKLYTDFFGITWAVPAAPFTTSTPVAARPAVAKGIGSASAEMVYVSSSGALFHTRYVSGGWTNPVAIDPSVTTFTHVAIASGP